MRTVAIVVTYNRKNLLLECIECLEKQTKRNTLDILIIDNASTDGTEEALRPMIEKKKLSYKNTGRNLGGAGGFEYGVLSVVNENYDYIWIMDDDTMPTYKALEEFYDFAEKQPKFGFLSSYVEWIDGNLCTMNVQRKNIFKKLSSFEGNIIPVQYATFVSLFVSTSTIKEVGAPIGEFFIWGDDWEFTRRISKKYKSYLIKNSVVIHKTLHNKGCDISNDVIERIPRYKLDYRNKMFISKQEGIKGLFYYYIKILKDVFNILINGKKPRILRIITMFKGIKEGFRFNPKIKYTDNF